MSNPSSPEPNMIGPILIAVVVCTVLIGSCQSFVSTTTEHLRGPATLIILLPFSAFVLFMAYHLVDDHRTSHIRKSESEREDQQRAANMRSLDDELRRQNAAFEAAYARQQIEEEQERVRARQKHLADLQQELRETRAKRQRGEL